MTGETVQETSLHKLGSSKTLTSGGRTCSQVRRESRSEFEVLDGYYVEEIAPLEASVAITGVEGGI